jgi:hypothetical protein
LAKRSDALASAFRIRHGVLEWREVEGEVVALDLRRKTYLAINRTGAVLWPALMTGATREELLARLTADFSVSLDEAASDLDAFLAELARQDLLEQREG